MVSLTGIQFCASTGRLIIYKALILAGVPCRNRLPFGPSRNWMPQRSMMARGVLSPMGMIQPIAMFWGNMRPAPRTIGGYTGAPGYKAAILIATGTFGLLFLMGPVQNFGSMVSVRQRGMRVLIIQTGYGLAIIPILVVYIGTVTLQRLSSTIPNYPLPIEMRLATISKQDMTWITLAAAQARARQNRPHSHPAPANHRLNHHH